jgi:hypothetical protein
MPAEVAAATGNNQPPNRVPATETRLAGALIDAELGEEIARAPFSVPIVTDAGASQSQGPVKDLPHGPAQAASADRGELSRWGQRMDARCKERFVRIDVANSRQKLLVHQATLDAPAPCLQGCQELFFGDLPRIRPKPGENLLEFAARAAT